MRSTGELIDALRTNGRASYAELARLVGLSSSAVHERVAKLEAPACITGFRAIVDPGAIGLGVTALVGIEPGEYGRDDVIAAELEAIPEVESCYGVAGDEAFVVQVRVRHRRRPAPVHRPAAGDRRRRPHADHRGAGDPVRAPADRGAARRGVTGGRPCYRSGGPGTDIRDYPGRRGKPSRRTGSARSRRAGRARRRAASRREFACR